MEYHPTNLIVNYLPQHMTDRELYSMFITVGPISKCLIMKDLKTGYSYGFGFVNFVNPNDSEKAIRMLNGITVFNKKIKVSYARPPGEHYKNTNLYISNLPKHFKENDLETLFRQYGTIIQSHILLDKLTGISRGVAFVRYSNKEEAQEAIKYLNGQIPVGGSEKLMIKVAEEHGRMKAAFHAGYKAALQKNRGGGGGARNGEIFSNAQGRERDGNTFTIAQNTGRPSHGNNLVSYPLRFTGPLRPERSQQRYNPISNSGRVQCWPRPNQFISWPNLI